MSEHSIAEAKDRLPELIERALNGEGVVITRHGRPIVELRPVELSTRALPSEAIDWLAQRRVGRHIPTQDAAALVRLMRDE